MKYNPKILKYLRTKKRKLTQDEAIKRMYAEVHLDITRPTLASWEAGETCPTLKHYPALCVFYDISATELISLFFGLKHSKTGYARANGRSKADRLN